MYVGVGSNLGDRVLNCERAIYEISEFSDVKAVSSLYETEPVGNEDQPLYINCALEIMTDITPHKLLEKLLGIESKLGRVRGQRRAFSSDAGKLIRGQRRVNVVREREQDKIGTAMPEYKKWGPRIIDLDILFYGEEIIDDPDLKVPHPEAHKRRFVLIPLVEIAPELIHPVFRVSARELLENIKDSHKVVKLDYSSTHNPQ